MHCERTDSPAAQAAHPAADLFPLLDEEHLAALAEDIREHGQREPVVLLDGAILDGRNRWRACERVGVRPRTRSVTVAEVGSPTAYVISTNLKRRHLTPVQAGTVAVAALPLFEQEAKARQIAGLKRGDEKPARPVQSAPNGTERRARVEAAKATGAGQRATAVLASVAQRAPDVFQAAREGKIATVADAARLAKLEPDKRAAVLDKIADGGKATSLIAETVRQGRVERLAEISLGNAPLAVPQRFPILLADPPWRYEHVETESRAIENQYPTMDLDAICALPVGDATTDDCVLFLWATSPKLAEAMRVVEAWGFTYRTCAVWVKDKIGMGYYFRQRHELLLVCTKGKPPTPAPADRLDSVIEGVRGQHSAKPIAAYEAIERMYPTLPRMEMFCRSPRDGWHVWGNQAR